jgi:hypothetical protein
MIVVVSAPQNRRWATATLWLAGATTLIYTLTRFLPVSPQSHNSVLDNSWMLALHTAFEQHWQFGQEVVFTYGPWGFLCGGYAPQTFAISMSLWALLSLVFWWAGWRMARYLSRHTLISWLWLMSLVTVAGVVVEQSIDIRLAAWVMLWLGLHFFAEDRPDTPVQAGLAVSLGLLSLTKFTGLVEATTIVVIIAADTVFRQRRFPWLALLFGASVLFFWIAAGQNLGSLGPFLQNSWRVTSGYTEAMSQVGEMEVQQVTCFLLAALLLIASIGRLAWQRHRYFGLFPITALGAVMVLSFKQSYVRCDDIHTPKAILIILVIALAGLAVTWPAVPEKKSWAGAAGLFPLFAVLFFSGTAPVDQYPNNGPLVQLVRTFDRKNLLASAKWLFDPDSLRKEHQAYLMQIRNAFPVPPLAGDVDIYPWNQAALLAHGLAYRPRPVFQSYVAYTPELAELNAAFLRSDQAASNILFEIRAIDSRFPSLNDGRSWPELLTRYDVTDAGGTFVHLQRSATPREYHLTPFKNLLVQFGETVQLPATNHGLLWAEWDIHPTGSGALVSLLYKPPALQLAVSLRDGRQPVFRLVPGMARGGFLLSPLIDNNGALVSLVATEGGRNLADEEVIALTISATTRSGTTRCYQSPMRLRLYHLDYPRQNLKEMTTGSTAPPLPPSPADPDR